MRWLGLDPGRKRIGVAVSDPQGKMAFPRKVIESRSWQEDVQAIATLAGEYEVEGIVVGFPRHLSGRVGEEADRAISFAKNLEKATGLQVVLWDERLSTVQAERVQKALGRKRPKAVDDQVAALILQSYLDAQVQEIRG